MKRTFQNLAWISTTTASLLALQSMAEENRNSVNTAAHAETADGMRTERLGRSARASDLIGFEVINYQGTKLGKIDDLTLDVEAGRIVQVILSTGGFLGIGDSLVAVPPGALHANTEDKVVQLNADKEFLKASPKFRSSDGTQAFDTNQVSEVYRYFDEQPYFGTSQMRSPNSGAAPARAEETTRANEQSSKPVTRWNSKTTTLGYAQQASKLMGTEVQNLQNEKLGKVENFVVDLSAGRIIAVIVSSGGFLGMGTELSAVPPVALQFSTDHNQLRLDATKDSLSNAPHFKADQWPDLSQPEYSYTLYQAYHVEPYFTTNAYRAVDNSAQNVRDRSNRSLTPMDQGNSASDRDRTARIRKGIVAGKGMSMNARNVKIITVDGQVTLRGPVESAEEKRLIGIIANDIAKSENVSNQLEVK